MLCNSYIGCVCVRSNTKCQKVYIIILSDEGYLFISTYFWDKLAYYLMNRCVAVFVAHHVLLLFFGFCCFFFFFFFFLFTGNCESDDRCSVHRQRRTSNRVGSSLPYLPHPVTAQFQPSRQQLWRPPQNCVGEFVWLVYYNQMHLARNDVSVHKRPSRLTSSS